MDNVAAPTVGNKVLQHSPTGMQAVQRANYEYNRVVPKQHGGAKVCWHIQILPEKVELREIRIGGYNVTDLIDPEIKRAALEEFRARYINVPA